MNHAEDMAKGLRELADAIESGALPAPFDFQAGLYWMTGEDGHITDKPTAEDARRAMDAAPGGWVKKYNGAYVDYVRSFGARVEYQIVTSRDEVCRKVQTGTKHVPAVEAHDEPVYEWVCNGDAEPAPDQS